MTNSELQELIATVNTYLKYEPDTGNFYWKKQRRGRARAGSLAGTLDAAGRRIISVNRKLFPAHHLAYLLTYGVLPAAPVRHINGDPADNRIANLGQFV